MVICSKLNGRASHFKFILLQLIYYSNLLLLLLYNSIVYLKYECCINVYNVIYGLVVKYLINDK